MVSVRGVGNPVVDAPERVLRSLRVPGYHAAQQHRSVERTRALAAAAWTEMAESPTRPLRLERVLDGAGASTSSFYARFDGLRPLVEFCGAVRVTLERESDRGAVARAGDLRTAMAEVFAPIERPGWLPREVLAATTWNDVLSADFARCRRSRLRDLAAGLAGPMGDGAVPLESTDVVVWLHLVSSCAELAWTVGGLLAGPDGLEPLLHDLRDLGDAVLFRSTSEPAQVGALAGPFDVGVDRPQVWRSDRGEQTVSDLLAAARVAVVDHGRDLTAADLGEAVHRSASAVHDTFGTVGALLAEVARTEEVCRIPWVVFRPRPTVSDVQVAAFVLARLRAWARQHGTLGRRLVQLAMVYPELAIELAGQAAWSVAQLTEWYEACFVLPKTQVQLLFALLYATALYEVAFGIDQSASIGADALTALLTPIAREPA